MAVGASSASPIAGDPCGFVSSTPRYTTLRDYLRVVRMHAIVIALAAALFGAAAYLYSARQEPQYVAEALLESREPAQDFELGAGAPLEETVEQRAARYAELVAQPSVARAVIRRLRLKTSPRELLAHVKASGQSLTFFVVVEARSSDPVLAARLANEFARQGVASISRAARRRFERAADALRARLGEVPRGGIERTALRERISRLQALAEAAVAAEIVRPAEVPRSPASPRTALNVVAGMVLGLAIGLLLAFLLDSLDRHVRRPADIEEDLDGPLLGQVRGKALGRVPMRTNGRKALSPDDIEGFRILRRNLELIDLEVPLRSVLVTSPLAAEGKSTVAAALAWAYAIAGKRTLLIECDLHRPSLAGRLGVSAGPGLTDHLTGRAEAGEVFQDVGVAAAFTANGNGSSASPPVLACITAGTTEAPGEVLRSPRWSELLSDATRAYDVVILDASPVLCTVDALELLPHVDAAILCVRASQTSRDEARAAKAAIDGLPTRLAGFVVTGVGRGDEFGSAAYAAGRVYPAARKAADGRSVR